LPIDLLSDLEKLKRQFGGEHFVWKKRIELIWERKIIKKKEEDQRKSSEKISNQRLTCDNRQQQIE